jgi:hypothetical protein
MDWMGLVRHAITIGAGALGYSATENGDLITAAAAGVVAIGTIIFSIMKKKWFPEKGA